MFDVGFSELIVIGIVALVVIGPERLPKVARTAGLLLGRMRRYVNDVKADISREMQLDELKQLQADMQESARSFERSIAGEIQAVEQTVHDTVQTAQSAIQDNPVTTEAVKPGGPGLEAKPAQQSSAGDTAVGVDHAEQKVTGKG